MAKILITGGAGYIGSHVVLSMLEANHDVVVIDNLSTGFRENLPENVAFIHGDVGDKGCVKETLKRFQPETIMHFAASSLVADAVAMPLQYYQNNISNTLVLLDCCVDANCVKKFIFSSTAAVYGILDSAATEQTQTMPINPYGYSKLVIERILADVEKTHKIKYVTLRYFNVAGADEQGRTGESVTNATHIIKVCCQVALGVREILPLFGTDYDTKDGTCIRDYIHISDLADAHLVALEYLADSNPSIIFNCGNGLGYSVRDIISTIEKHTQRPLPVEEHARRPGDPPLLITSPKLIQEKTRWKPSRTLEDMVQTAFSWEQKLQTNK